MEAKSENREAATFWRNARAGSLRREAEEAVFWRLEREEVVILVGVPV